MLEGSFSPVYIPSPARREPLFNVVSSTDRRGRSLASGLKPGRLPTGHLWWSCDGPEARPQLLPIGQAIADGQPLGRPLRGVWGAARPPPAFTDSQAQAQRWAWLSRNTAPRGWVGDNRVVQPLSGLPGIGRTGG